MIFESKDDEKEITKILLECDCGHGIIEIVQYEEDAMQGMIYISYYESGWYNNYRPVRENIRRFFHNLWKVINGGQYEHYDILLQGHEVKALKEAINKLKEGEKK